MHVAATGYSRLLDFQLWGQHVVWVDFLFLGAKSIRRYQDRGLGFTGVCLSQHSSEGAFHCVSFISKKKIFAATWMLLENIRVKWSQTEKHKYMIPPTCSAGKESVCTAGDPGLIPGSGRSAGEGKGYKLQYYCLENSPWNSPGYNIGVGSLSLLQGIFLTQESNRGLLHCRWTLYQLSYQGSPRASGATSKILPGLASRSWLKIKRSELFLPWFLKD